MKKSIISTLLGLLPLLLISVSNAQSVTDNSKTLLPEAILNPAASDHSSDKTSRSDAKQQKRYNRAINSFAANYKDAKDVNWNMNDEGYTASFNAQNVKNVIYYNKSGYLMYTLAIYSGDKLPDGIRREVLDSYRGYKITGVDEVHHFDQAVYVVHLEDETSIKLILVTDEGITPYKDYSKAKS